MTIESIGLAGLLLSALVATSILVWAACFQVCRSCGKRWKVAGWWYRDDDGSLLCGPCYSKGVQGDD